MDLPIFLGRFFYMNKSTKLLVYTAVLTAFATIANIYTIPINGGRKFFSLEYIP